MNEIQANIGNILADNQILKADVALIVDDIIWHHTYQPEGETQPPNTRYLIYSIAKTYMAALIMKLVEEKWLKLDDQVNKYFPDIPKLQGVTIQHLLNHTSGIPDYGLLPAYLKALVSNPFKPWTFDEYVDRTLSQEMLCYPGERFNYSNLGYAFLNQIIQKVTKTSFDKYLTETILAPLRLGDTLVLHTAEDLLQIVPAMTYSVVPSGQAVDVRYHYHPDWVAHGLLASTAEEVARFLNALFRGQIVSKESLELMMKTIQVAFQSPYFIKPAYGLGLMAADTPGGRIYGHTGGGPGFIVAGYYLKSEKPITFTILTTNEMAFSLEKAMLDILLVVNT
jgi:D-alanyl-D-alanine carboxypeptidase